MAETPEEPEDDGDLIGVAAKSDLIILGLAGVIYALNPKGVTPRESFVCARAFVAEATSQMPLVMTVIKGAMSG